MEQVAAQLNSAVAADRGLWLQVARWETDAYPDFHLDGPQGICDQVLDIEDCEILVGIFWTRFGKPTPSGMTGTEHEISKAVRGWREKQRPHIMMFFNKSPVSLRSAADCRQYTRVAEYRENFPVEGLYWEYDGPEHFEREFRGCVERLLRKHFPVEAPRDAAAKESRLEREMRSDLTSTRMRIAFDSRIPIDRMPTILTAISDFNRGLGGGGLSLDLTVKWDPEKGGDDHSA